MKMPKYISREELIEALEADYNSDWDRLPDTGDYVEGVRDEYDDVLTIICRMKGTDAQPVRRGRWIKQEGFWNKNTVKCSLCGNYLNMNGVNGGRSDANFCPNCGARMGLDNDMRNLTDEETDIYNSRLEAEAETIDGISLL
jgi:hypothetical protein